MNPKTTKTELASPEFGMREVASAGTLAADQLAQIEQAMHADQLEFTYAEGVRAGRRQLVEAAAKVADVGNLLELQELKKSKKFKGLRVLMDGKNLLTIRTWEDYCIHSLERSRAQVDEDLMNLERFGAEMLEGLHRMGLSVRNMRQMRSLPPADLATVAEAAKTGDVDQVKQAAEDAIERLRMEREEADRKHVNERAAFKGELTAKDDRYRRVYGQLGDAQDKLERRDLARGDERESADIDAVKASAAAAEIALRHLLGIASEVAERYNAAPAALMAQQAVEFIARLHASLIHERGFDIDFAAEAGVRFLDEAGPPGSPPVAR